MHRRAGSSALTTACVCGGLPGIATDCPSLGGWPPGLTAADQRITEDVEKFAFAISELYSYTFKPLLDVVLFTRALAKSMG